MAILFNQSSDIAENYKGHIEILETDGGDEWFNPDELQDWTVSTIVDTEKHYSTTGQKRKTIIGNSSVYEWRVKKTADFYDAVDPPTEVKTVSYWKDKIYGKPAVISPPAAAIPPELVIISLRGVSESNAASNRFIVDEFTATVENIDEIRDESRGYEEIIVSGEIITHTINTRQVDLP